MNKTFEMWWEEAEAHADNCFECLDGQKCSRVPQPWTDDEDERRELYNRRFTKPEPPEGMSPIKSIHSLQKETDVRFSSKSHPRRVDALAA